MNKIFFHISIFAKEINQNAYVIGEYVLFLLIKKTIYQNIDIFTNGNGILLAQKVYQKFYYYSILTLFKRFSTARFKIKNNNKNIEFIGNNISINTIAISLNKTNNGLLIDTSINLNIYYNNIQYIIRTIRFSCELHIIEQISFYFIFKQKKHIRIVYIEGTMNDFNRMILSKKPSLSLRLLYETNLLSRLLPEVTSLNEFKEKNRYNHKNNFIHTLEVVDNVSKESNSLWLRWVALLHDIGKSITKKFISGIGWTFHAHEYIGARMIPYIFYRIRFPMDYPLLYIQKIIQYSSRPIALVSYETTNSAISRLLFYIGKNIEDLILFCKADITTKNFEKKNRYKNNFLLVEKKIKSFEKKDGLQKLTTLISGHEIMLFFNLKSSPQIGIIKKAIKEVIYNTKSSNNFSFVYYR